MKRLAALSVLLLLLFGNCHKQAKELKVSYKVQETSGNHPPYTISYTSNESGSTTSVNSSLEEWNSNVLLLPRGEFISLTVDCTAPSYNFSIDILVDGGIFREAQLSNPNTSITISGNVGGN